jgi:hypothetical protein
VDLPVCFPDPGRDQSRHEDGDLKTPNGCFEAHREVESIKRRWATRCSNRPPRTIVSATRCTPSLIGTFEFVQVERRRVR